MQSKRRSLIESTTNTFVGTCIGFGISQLFCYGQVFISEHIIAGFSWNVSAENNLIVTIVLTIVSVTRGYFVRRTFNSMRERREDGLRNIEEIK